MTALDDLKAAVAAEKTVTLSAVTLLVSLKGKLDAAIAADDDGVALEELSSELGASTSALAAAVTANTPAEPTPGDAGPTSNTATTAPEDLPDDHPLKPAS